jgi:hypothetical protein
VRGGDGQGRYSWGLFRSHLCRGKDEDEDEDEDEDGKLGQEREGRRIYMGIYLRRFSDFVVEMAREDNVRVLREAE